MITLKSLEPLIKAIDKIIVRLAAIEAQPGTPALAGEIDRMMDRLDEAERNVAWLRAADITPLNLAERMAALERWAAQFPPLGVISDGNGKPKSVTGPASFAIPPGCVLPSQVSTPTLKKYPTQMNETDPGDWAKWSEKSGAKPVVYSNQIKPQPGVSQTGSLPYLLPAAQGDDEATLLALSKLGMRSAEATLAAICAGQVPGICMKDDAWAVHAEAHERANAEIANLKAQLAALGAMNDSLVKQRDQLRAEIANLKDQVAEAHNEGWNAAVNDTAYFIPLNEARVDLARVTAERDEWKANHDNQVKLRRELMDRPDLGDRAKSIERLTAELAEAKAGLEAKTRISLAQADVIHELKAQVHSSNDAVNVVQQDQIRLRNERDALKTKLAAVEDAEMSLHKGLRSLRRERDLAHARADLARATAERDGYHRKACDIADYRDRLTAELAEAKALLTEAVDIAKGIRGCAERGAPNITWQDWWARLQKVEAIVAAGGSVK